MPALHTMDRIALAAMMSAAIFATLAALVACAGPPERIARIVFADGE